MDWDDETAESGKACDPPASTEATRGAHCGHREEHDREQLNEARTGQRREGGRRHDDQVPEEQAIRQAEWQIDEVMSARVERRRRPFIIALVGIEWEAQAAGGRESDRRHDPDGQQRSFAGTAGPSPRAAARPGG